MSEQRDPERERGNGRWGRGRAWGRNSTGTGQCGAREAVGRTVDLAESNQAVGHSWGLYAWVLWMEVLIPAFEATPLHGEGSERGQAGLFLAVTCPCYPRETRIPSPSPELHVTGGATTENISFFLTLRASQPPCSRVGLTPFPLVQEAAGMLSARSLSSLLFFKGIPGTHPRTESERE